MKINGFFLLIYINLINFHHKIKFRFDKKSCERRIREKWRYAIAALLWIENGRLPSTYVLVI